MIIMGGKQSLITYNFGIMYRGGFPGRIILMIIFSKRIGNIYSIKE